MQTCFRPWQHMRIIIIISKQAATGTLQKLSTTSFFSPTTPVPPPSAVKLQPLEPYVTTNPPQTYIKLTVWGTKRMFQTVVRKPFWLVRFENISIYSEWIASSSESTSLFFSSSQSECIITMGIKLPGIQTRHLCGLYHAWSRCFVEHTLQKLKLEKQSPEVDQIVNASHVQWFADSFPAVSQR